MENNEEMKKYAYYAQAMHLHCCSQMGASMASHMENAAALGMRYIHFTEHDTRMGRREYELDAFDFTRHETEYSDFDGQSVKLSPVGDINMRFVGDELELSADKEAGVELIASGKRQTRPLTSGVTLAVGISGNAQVRLDIMLSQRPPDHTPAHFVYSLDPSVEVHTLHVSDDIPEELGGLDNALAGVTLYVSGGTIRLSRLEIHSEFGYAEILRRQREVAEQVGARYGIKPFVTYEISGAGQHKNCFSTSVPILDYEKHGWKISAAEAVRHVKAYNGVFSYNHPFDRYKRMTLTDNERSRLVAEMAAELAASHVWGADVIEVGFPMGRHGFTLDEHLRLWDLLSLSGIFITADGDNDSHFSHQGAFSGNNFAAWIAADADLPFPVPESEFEDSLRAGRAYTGDPIYLKGAVDFTADGCPMGAVLVHTEKTAKQPRTFCFTADNVGEGWRARVILDGELFSETVADSEHFDLSWTLIPRRAVTFVRVEMYNEEGRCILLTNPIYMVNTDIFAGEVPTARIYGGAK